MRGKDYEPLTFRPTNGKKSNFLFNYICTFSFNFLLFSWKRKDSQQNRIQYQKIRIRFVIFQSNQNPKFISIIELKTKTSTSNLKKTFTYQFSIELTYNPQLKITFPGCRNLKSEKSFHIVLERDMRPIPEIPMNSGFVCEYWWKKINFGQSSGSQGKGIIFSLFYLFIPYINPWFLIKGNPLFNPKKKGK